MNKITLYKPYEHQRVVHNAITSHINKYERFTEPFQKIFVVKACRQVGKSAMAENELGRFALQYNKSINAYVAPTLKLSKKTFEEVIKMFDGSDLIKAKNKTDLIIEFVNGSIIYFFSGEQRDNLRGFTVSGLLVIDEAAFIPNDIYVECLSPWCDAKKAITLMISTPQFKAGFFYDHYVIGLSGSKSVQSFDFTEYDLSIIRSAEKLEEKRLTIPDKKFKCEYLGMWLDGEGSVFNDFNKVFIRDFAPFKELYVGIDWGTGSGQDSTVVSGLNESGEQSILWKNNRLEPTECIEEISNLLQGKNIKKILVEMNSIGKIYYDLLKRKVKNVEGFNTTNDSKRKLVEQFQVAIEQDKCKLKEDRDQTNQLSFYESSFTSTGKIAYNAKKGFHDDIVIADMLAWEAYRRKGSNYRVSFI